jgi:hypothetical protein
MTLTGNFFRKDTHAPDEGGLLVHCEFIDQLKFIKPNSGIRHICISSRNVCRHGYLIRIVLTLSKGFLLEDMGIRFENGQGTYGLKPYGAGQFDKISFTQVIKKYDSAFITGKIFYRTFDGEKVLSPCMEPFRVRLT